MLKKIFFTLIILMVPFDYSHAQESRTFPRVQKVEDRDLWKPHIALMGGVTTPEGSYRSGGEVNLDVGFQQYIPFGNSVELGYSRIEDNKGDSLYRTTLLLKGTYNFGGTTPVIKNSYVGFGIGSMFVESNTLWTSAPLLGFDIPLKKAEHYFVSLGANAKYLITSGSDPDSLSLSGVVKYWY